MDGIESGVGSLHYAKQTNATTIAAPNATGTVRLRHQAGALKPGKTYGQEEYTDGEAFATPSMFVQSIGGEVGAVTFQAQPETGPLVFAQIVGVDVVTGAADPYTHTMTSGAANGTWGTWRQSVGGSIGPFRQAYWQSKISKLAWQCGIEQMVSHMEATPIALKAGDVYTTAPTATDSGSDPFNWNESATKATIDTANLPEIQGETLEIDRKLSVERGNNGPNPIAVIPGKGSIDRAVTTYVTASTLAIANQILYDTSTPTDTTAVSSTVKYLAIENEYVRSATRSLKITTPKVAVKPEDIEIAPTPEGGKIAMTLGGPCLKSGSTPALTIVAKTGDPTSYV